MLSLERGYTLVREIEHSRIPGRVFAYPGGYLQYSKGWFSA